MSRQLCNGLLSQLKRNKGNTICHTIIGHKNKAQIHYSDIIFSKKFVRNVPIEKCPDTIIVEKHREAK